MTIKMSDVFELPIEKYSQWKECDFEKVSAAMVTAINAYDANQERIKELEALLVKEKEFSKSIQNSPIYKSGLRKYWS